MKKNLLFLTLISFCALNAQIQISNFTYNNVQKSSPKGIQEFNGKIFFSAVNDGYGRELWSSDGTSTNTNMVIDIDPGLANGVRGLYSTILNNKLYFVANDNSSGGEIWKTDGTEIGSSLVITYNGRIYGLTTVGNQIFYITEVSDDIIQIWKTDGTNSGTVLVRDNIAIWNSPTFQGSVNNTFIFTIQVPLTTNSKVWRSDGTQSGTYALTSEIDGNGSAGSTFEFSQYINYNNKLYFVTRYFLYETDGTISGTNQIANFSWNNLVSFGDVVELNGEMYFSFFLKDNKKLSIYESDGTSSGTSEVYTVTSSQYFYPSYLNSSGNNLIFSSVNSNNGTSLFYLESSTHLVTEIIEIDQFPQEPNIFYGNFTALSLDHLSGSLFFVSSPSNANVFSKKGWILDEASSTLTPVAALDHLIQGAGQKIVYNNDLYYFSGYQLWKFDSNSLSISSVNDIQELKIFPNPVSDFICFNKPDDIYQVKIYNINRKLVLKESMSTTNKIDVKDLNSGIYIVNIVGKNGRMTTRKLLKK